MSTEEIIYSSLACLTFVLLFVVLVIPNVKTSAFIHSSEHSKYGEKSDCYFITLTNLSPISLNYVQINIFRTDRLASGINGNSRELVSLYFTPWLPGYRQNRIKGNLRHEIRVDIIQNLPEVLCKDNKTLVAEFSFRHGITGLGKKWSKEFTCENTQMAILKPV